VLFFRGAKEIFWFLSPSISMLRNYYLSGVKFLTPPLKSIFAEILMDGVQYLFKNFFTEGPDILQFV